MKTFIALCAVSVLTSGMIVAMPRHQHHHLNCKPVADDFDDFKYSWHQGYGSDVHPEQFLDKYRPAWKRRAAEACISGRL